MRLPNIYGQGQLFAYSGIEGKSTYIDGLCGFLMGDRIGISLKNPFQCQLFFKNVSFKKLEYDFVSGDTITATADGEKLSVIAVSENSIVGCCPSKADVDIYTGEMSDKYYVSLKKKREMYSFAFGSSQKEADERAEKAFETNIDDLVSKRKKYISDFGYEGKYDLLCRKVISVMKTQIYSPEGIIPVRWSTPDRFPHRSMWLWDSVFHSIGFRHIDTVLAEELIEAIFTYQTDDGFIPHFSNPTYSSKISQPPVIAWGALKVFEKSGNLEFLEKIYLKNKIFLEWCDDNRRKSEKKLYTWLTEPDLNCRCGESGMDNSTRFDTTDELFAIDFSCFMANDVLAMKRIAEILGAKDDASYYDKWYDDIKNDINEYLWDKEQEFYFDRTLDGKMHDVSSVASFLPLLCSVCDDYQAQCLVKALKDPDRFGTDLPVPTIEKRSKYFGDDMWRGPVWINFNYFIIEGLRHYGFDALADDICSKTIETVNKYYLMTGCTFEFYDSEDKMPPFVLNRKGRAIFPYNPYVRYQTIRDYGWTGTLVFDMLNDSH